MSFFSKVDSYANAIGNSEQSSDYLLKVAADNNVSYNDLVVHHNLVNGNIFTSENIIKVAEDQAQSPLTVAVDAYEALSTGAIDGATAMNALHQAGLTEDDYGMVGALIEKQAEEAGILEKEVLASDGVWEKVAQAHNFLMDNGIDPVYAMEFAENFNDAQTDYEADKVASEYDGLDEVTIDKIAQAVDFLSDVQGETLTDLMYAFDKEADESNGTTGTKTTRNKAKEFFKAYKDALKGGKGRRLNQAGAIAPLLAAAGGAGYGGYEALR